MTDSRDKLSDDLLQAIHQAEWQMEEEHGPPPPGYHDVVRLDKRDGTYTVSVHRESVREIRVSVVGSPS